MKRVLLTGGLRHLARSVLHGEFQAQDRQLMGVWYYAYENGAISEHDTVRFDGVYAKS